MGGVADSMVLPFTASFYQHLDRETRALHLLTH
jgi:hypothetical protein